MSKKEKWDLVIEPKRKLFNLRLYELIRYKDLLFMFVKRDVVTLYKQTILGPLWILLQPLLQMSAYVIVFAGIFGSSTDSLPPVLFYFTGIVIWNYFAESLTQTANTFTLNSSIFGKVYFPRLIVPLSKIAGGLIKFGMQFLLFLTLYLYFAFTTDLIHPNKTLILFPLLVILMAGLGMGIGLIFSSLTTKYKDLVFLLQFGVQLAMYGSAVIFPLSQVDAAYQKYLMLNPVVPIVETFKHGFFSVGIFSINGLIYCSIITIIVLFLGIFIFNKTEQNFIDTV